MTGKNNKPPPVVEVATGSWAIRALHGRGREILWKGIVLSGALIGLAITWRVFSPQIATSPQFALDPRTIHLTPRPAWVQFDILDEVIQDASLDDGLSLLEPDLLGRLERAFALNPWVREVSRVAKHGSGRVEVELVYRRPVCLVEVPGGLFAVDAQGVLLPSRDFSAADSGKYPRLTGIPPGSWGPTGVAWRDVRVTDGALLAEFLSSEWSSLGLWCLTPWEPPEGAAGGTAFELVTHHDKHIVWGSPPGGEQSGEPTAAEKLLRLKQLLAPGAEPAPDVNGQPLDLRWAERPGQLR